jgi:hypothetical protein
MRRRTLIFSLLTATTLPLVGEEQFPTVDRQVTFGWLTSDVETGFHVGIDENTARSGNKSAIVRAKKPNPELHNTIFQAIRADGYRGKRIRVSGYLKTESADVGWLWVRVDSADGTLCMDNMQNRPARGTTDWTRYDLIIDIPDDALGFSYGLGLTGNGAAWADDFSVEIVDRSVATTNNVGTTLLAHDSLRARFRKRYVIASTAPLNSGLEE